MSLTAPVRLIFRWFSTPLSGEDPLTHAGDRHTHLKRSLGTAYKVRLLSQIGWSQFIQ